MLCIHWGKRLDLITLCWKTKRNNASFKKSSSRGDNEPRLLHVCNDIHVLIFLKIYLDERSFKCSFCNHWIRSDPRFHCTICPVTNIRLFYIMYFIFNLREFNSANNAMLWKHIKIINLLFLWTLQILNGVQLLQEVSMPNNKRCVNKLMLWINTIKFFLTWLLVS